MHDAELFFGKVSYLYFFRLKYLKIFRLTDTYDLKFSDLESENIRATVVLTLSSHGGKRLRPSQRVFLWNLCEC